MLDGPPLTATGAALVGAALVGMVVVPALALGALAVVEWLARRTCR